MLKYHSMYCNINTLPAPAANAAETATQTLPAACWFVAERVKAISSCV